MGQGGGGTTICSRHHIHYFQHGCRVAISQLQRSDECPKRSWSDRFADQVSLGRAALRHWGSRPHWDDPLFLQEPGATSFEEKVDGTNLFAPEYRDNWGIAGT